MKTLVIACVLSVLTFSCQDEANQNENQEMAWKKKTKIDPDFSTVDADKATDAPIDGGLGVLLVGGVAYGVRRFYKKKDKSPS